MSDRHEGKMANRFASHFPTPYGCLSLVAVILGALSALVLSSIAIGIAIIR
jgi:hypothetical protein